MSEPCAATALHEHIYPSPYFCMFYTKPLCAGYTLAGITRPCLLVLARAAWRFPEAAYARRGRCTLKPWHCLRARHAVDAHTHHGVTPAAPRARRAPPHTASVPPARAHAVDAHTHHGVTPAAPRARRAPSHTASAPPARAHAARRSALSACAPRGRCTRP